MLAQVDLERARRDGVSVWSRIPLCFVRTAEVGKLVFNGARFDSKAVLGEGRASLNMLLEGFEFSKIMISSLAIGAFDSALRLAVNETADRKLYGRPVIELPHVKDVIIRSFLAHLGAQCLTRLALVGASKTPDRLWGRANACKAYTGRVLERATAELSPVMGTRAFVRDGRAKAMLEKIVRDMAFPRQIHSSAVVSSIT